MCIYLEKNYFYIDHLFQIESFKLRMFLSSLEIGNEV